MRDPSDASDRKAKLSRFHSLLFGTENAIANGDHETSLGLGLRLAGFLASEVKTPQDEVYIQKILPNVHENIVSACQATQSDRYNPQLSQKGSAPGLIQSQCSFWIGTQFNFQLVGPAAGIRKSQSFGGQDSEWIESRANQTCVDMDVTNCATSSSASRLATTEQLESEADVLEQGNCSPGFQFSNGKPIDLDRVKRSKYLGNIFPPTGTLQKEPEPSSARVGPTLQSEPSTSFRERMPTPKLDSNNSAERGESVSGRNLCQAKLTSLYTGSRTKPVEKFRPAAIGQQGSSGVSYHDNKASSSRSLPAAGDVSPNEDDHFSRKRGPLLDSNRPAQKKSRPESEDDGEYDTRRRYQSNGRASTRGDSDVDDDAMGRRSQNPNRNRGKIKPEHDDISDDDVQELPTSFVTAKQQLAMNEAKKNRGNVPPPALGCNSYNYGKKTLGMRPRGPRGAFIPPFRGSKANGGTTSRFEDNSESGAADESTRRCMEMLAGPDGELPDRLRNIEPKLLEHITNEIMERDPMVRWDDIAGLEHAKKCVTEMVIWPLLRPDIFQGCRAPAKGLLLFGPPGTGKTMIGKAIAGEAKATFFSISASSVMSKWLGEAEKLVRALFGVAACRQPAVIFIDEVDSLLSQRKSEGENECSRKIKTQFLVEMEGCGTGSEQVLVIGATNRPQELDEAARRRLSKRLYIPLPSSAARSWIVRNLLGKDGLLSLSDEEIDEICTCTDGYSGSDMKNLVKEASMGPLREALMNGKNINDIRNDDMRPISLQDFMSALQQVRSSVSQDELGMYEDWNKQYGSLAV